MTSITATRAMNAMFDALRTVRLRGFNGAQPYLNSDFSLERVNPDDLYPCQSYVLKPILESQARLWALLLEKGIDVTKLTQAHYAEFNGETIPVLPPIVEESVEFGGRKVVWLINDGLHRVTYARNNNKRINVVVVHGVNPEYPYYAHINPNRWDDVKHIDALPPGFVKKLYRYPERYKDYFRDFNGVFPGIQKDRPIPQVA